MTTYTSHVGDVTLVWTVDTPSCTCPEGDVPDDPGCPLHGEER